MSPSRIAQDFDAISPSYDATRDPLDDPTLDALAASLRERGVRRVLEVGIGTGRVSLPLRDRGFEVTGLDMSRGMLRRAREKGLERLVRGSAYQLPFPDRAFDAALFVHVLHVLEEPEPALGEAIRVARAGAFGLVHPPGHDPRRGSEAEAPRRLVFEQLRAQGLAIPDRPSPWRRERDLLSRHPPDQLTVLAEREVTESAARRIDVLATRAHRWSLDIPPPLLEKAIAKVRAQLGDRQVTYHRTEALARWSGPIAARAPG